MTALPSARDKRAVTAQPMPLRLDRAALISLQRTVGNAATGAVLTRLRVLARRPDEAKVRARAFELYERSGGGIRSRERDEANYFEALRQVEIEERAHAIAKDRGGHDPVANYYEAERQIAEERKAKTQVEEAKPVESATPVIEEVKPAAVAEEIKTPVAAESKVEQAKPKAAYVLPHKREGYTPTAAVRTAPPSLAPGVYRSDQLTRWLGFKSKAGNHLQLDVRGWQGFAVHVSVYHARGTFDELHVKFDLGRDGSAWFFFDTEGHPLLNKTSSVGHRRKLLRTAGCPEHELQGALDRMTEIAQEETNWVVSQLR